MREAKIETWRVVLGDGTTREVRAAQYEPGDAEAWAPDYRSYHKGAATMRQAVAKVAVANEWPVAELLEPGERSRSEWRAENAAILDAVREYIRCAGSACPSCGGRGMVLAGYAIEEACEECVARDNLATLAGCYE